MRGDSLRDLYAKSLALLGLGVLAGAGALVDYWPGRSSYPGAVSVLVPPSAAPLLSVEHAALLPPPAPAPSRSLRLRLIGDTGIPQVAATVVVGPAPLVLASIPAVESPAVQLGHQIALSEPNSHMAMLVSESDAQEEMVYLSSAMDLQLRPLPPLASSAPDASTGDGMLTGAFKKTGSSIVRTGVWTGSSIVGAIRVVGSAVRRALPD